MSHNLSLLTRRCFLLFYDFIQALVGYVHLALGRHNKIYSSRSGNRPTDQKHSRAAVVAIYPNNDILPFLQNLFKALIAEDFFVLVVSTRRLNEVQSEAIIPFCHHVIERYPMGRDFGSYRIGLQWLEKQRSLEDVDTMALINDSLFYPKSIRKTLRTALAEGADWTILYENFEYHYHAQSFFQLFKKPLFSSTAFTRFWKNYKPYSSRKHSIMKGEGGLTRVLCKAGFQPYALYASARIRRSVFKEIFEDRASNEFNFIIRLSVGDGAYSAIKQYYEGDKYSESRRNDNDSEQLKREGNQIITVSADRASSEFVATEIASRIGVLGESYNPTHMLGLLCNYLFGAPIKRDICYREFGETDRGMHSIADVVGLASGFEQAELKAMERDLRRKGVPAGIRGIRKVLHRAGRL